MSAGSRTEPGGYTGQGTQSLHLTVKGRITQRACDDSKADGQFDVEDGHQYPRYNIRYAESPDGIHLNKEFEVCVDMSAGEYRVGRPYVIKRDGIYCMFYGAGTKEEGYRLAYAESPDGRQWTRKDSEVGIDVSESGWDSRMQAYPAIVSTGSQTYLFYNGNDYGREGFGYAILTD